MNYERIQIMFDDVMRKIRRYDTEDIVFTYVMGCVVWAFVFGITGGLCSPAQGVNMIACVFLSIAGLPLAIGILVGAVLLFKLAYKNLKSWWKSAGDRALEKRL